MVLSLVRMHAWPWLVVAASAVIGSGEGGRAPLGLVPPVPAAVFAAAPAVQPNGASGCYTPQFTVNVAPIGPGDFLGLITGDIEGTVEFTFAGSFKFTGATIANGGTAHWEVTSGLAGAVAFETVFDNRNQASDRPGSPAWLFENIGRHRATDGVEKANFTYNGTFDGSIPAGVHDYQGVLCL